MSELNAGKLLVGYARVSTDAQDLTAQRDALAGLGVAPERTYVDHGLTGTNRERPGLREALAACRAGDTLVVTKLDRLARSLPDARDIAADLTRREVKLSLGGSVYDPTDPVGRLLFNVLAMVAEFESDLIRARTREGMAVARAKGRLRGKSPKLTPKQEAHLVALHHDGEHTSAELAELFAVARSTVYRAIERARAATPPAQPVPAAVDLTVVPAGLPPQARPSPTLAIYDEDRGVPAPAPAPTPVKRPAPSGSSPAPRSAAAPRRTSSSRAPAKKATSGRKATRKTEASPAGTVPAGTVYQLKVVLLDVEPMVWRRLQIPSSATLTDLHHAIQALMGWEDYHLHSFKCGWDTYGGYDGKPETATLAHVLTGPGGRIGYVYDFGDNWEHLIEVEKILTRPRAGAYPRCTAGRRACPPEDSGGPYGYADMLKILRSRKGYRYRELREQLGTGRWDPEAFDLDEINTALAETTREPR